ncbi:hypothetical protein A2462_06565 [candidate division WOR-1 bacterium RIFOXYC2_FULL_41_25]|uniref:Uncharacterized protein n=1 Tax=candidate division WOR-1 bacterium RIFOXYC2_FULL_41_25 TaxID=1802586 RepID=A0A1F4TMW3_UNCSA|nr:MAG: hypothetical protein A2462_06565 [candidate division WOR-1 bacterium RIFOXYC2_FULL_41_25]
MGGGKGKGGYELRVASCGFVNLYKKSASKSLGCFCNWSRTGYSAKNDCGDYYRIRVGAKGISIADRWEIELV